MAAVKQATIDGFNEFLNQQKQTPGECRLLLAQFDDKYEVVLDKPLAEVPPLNDSTFVPRAMTALFDAMGKTIIDLGQKLDAMPEEDRPDRVLLATITDGQENSSTEFSQADIKRMVGEQTAKYQWDFVFIGANQDAVLTAAGFGIRPDAALSYNANARSVAAMSASLSRYATRTRKMSHASRSSGERAMFTPNDRNRAKK